MDLRKDIYFYADLASFPATGALNLLYVDKSTGLIYTWNGSSYAAAGSGGLKYSGTWNASTNSPTITSGVGSAGEYYIVSVAGTTNIDGISDWGVNDWIIFGGSAWQKIDNSETTGYVTSVGGTAPIASSGGTTPTISISQANGSTDGYLSSTDWNTFNNKVDKSIYSADGAITGNRVVNLNGNTLRFSNGPVEFDQGSTNSGEIRLYEDSDFGSNKVTLRAAQSMSADTSFFFPPNSGSNGYVLSTNGAGATSWIAAPGGLTYFTEAENTSAPNGTVYVDSLTATASSTNADFVIKPKGTGALIAAIPDNTATGGNKRGQYAVDWQLLRGNLAQVASGDYSVILGGYNNTASGARSMILGGDNNTAAGAVSVAIGGSNNSTAAGVYTTTIGYSNTSSANFSTAIGYQSTASGSAAVALGQQNSVSGTNASALGHSNIANNQYSAAVGFNNTSSGIGSIALGSRNTASGTGSAAIGGHPYYGGNTASGEASLASGQGSISSGYAAFAMGVNNVSDYYGTVATGLGAKTFGLYGRNSHSCGYIGTVGDNQKSTFTLGQRTTNNTPTTLISYYAAGTTPSAVNQVILSNQSAYRFKGTIIGKKSGTTDIASWDVDGLIVRGANAASTTLVVNNVNLVSNTPAWGTPTLAADTTNGGLQVQVTGAAATNIQWTAVIETTEVIYA